MQARVCELLEGGESPDRLTFRWLLILRTRMCGFFLVFERERERESGAV